MKLIFRQLTTLTHTGVEGSFTLSDVEVATTTRTFGFSYDNIETDDRMLRFTDPLKDGAELWTMTEGIDPETLTAAQEGFIILFTNLLEPEIHTLLTRGGDLVNGLKAQGWKEREFGRTNYEQHSSFDVQAEGKTEQAMRAVLAM